MKQADVKYDFTVPTNAFENTLYTTKDCATKVTPLTGNDAVGTAFYKVAYSVKEGKAVDLGNANVAIYKAN